MKQVLALGFVVGVGLVSPAVTANTVTKASIVSSQNTPDLSCEIKTPQAQVSVVYPTADHLPENLLRFYIYFSKPMQREDILSSVYLTDSNGNKVEGVFLDNRFDLWSADSTRLTLLFDPGRVKTGLVAHNAMGRALQPGYQYQLKIDASAIDAEGCHLQQAYSKSFKAIEADYSIPDASQWQISQLKQGSREALTVELNGLMDHLSLAYRMRVKDHSGATVPGRIKLSKQEQQWLFIPDHPWGNRGYQLMVDPVLEDVVGNRLSGLFDQPSLAKESETGQQWISIPLSVRKK